MFDAYRSGASSAIQSAGQTAIPADIAATIAGAVAESSDAGEDATTAGRRGGSDDRPVDGKRAFTNAPATTSTAAATENVPKPKPRPRWTCCSAHCRRSLASRSNNRCWKSVVGSIRWTFRTKKRARRIFASRAAQSEHLRKCSRIASARSPERTSSNSATCCFRNVEQSISPRGRGRGLRIASEYPETSGSVPFVFSNLRPGLRRSFLKHTAPLTV